MPGMSVINAIIKWDHLAGTYTVTPANLAVPPGFGTGASIWPSPAYLNWYIMPKHGDTVVFHNDGNGTQGIAFESPLADMDVSYDTNGLTATVAWECALGPQDPNVTYQYYVNLLINGMPTTIDPDVENQAPPPGT